MIDLPGYRIFAQIYSSSRTLVYRGERKSDSQNIIIKLMRNQYPTFSQIVQFRNQYTITKNLKLAGVIQPYSLETYQNSLALIMEDFGGISLKQLMDNEQGGMGKSAATLTDFFQIAIQIATTLDRLHCQKIIHKDIKPANLLINPTTKQVKITDFSIASLLPKESQTLTSPNILEGTLAYLSPEQTGRMNRGIDYRSDFYSLGVTFYEVLTGKLPFTPTDPMELVHSHIAKHPASVHSINKNIPPILAKIIEKMMAKNAEDRYQSALGLKHDLETCLNQWENSGKIQNFELGKRDISERFIIPEKLYGREAEVAEIIAAFDRVGVCLTNNLSLKERTSQPEKILQCSPEMMLVAGYSGIGKTAVVNEVHKPIARQRGYFIKGKFDQFQRNIPFWAIVQAFRDLMAQILSESPQEIEIWKAKILEAVGENGQVIIEVIPEVEFLIGKQPPVPHLEANAAQNRFNLVLQNFIKLFASANHPLVIFLDDLQWADLASLNLIQLLLTETDIRYLLVIGAYRDNEVFPAHPLMLTLDKIRQKIESNVKTITLAPLSKSDLNNLIADTLSCPAEVALPLTELVYKKTKGNPFFSNQFLKSLHEDELIKFNFEARYWQCDIAEVKKIALTDDVVEFMALQLQKLPENTREVLKLAACIGNSFDLHSLAIVYQKSLADTAADLWKALQEGLIIPTNEIYKFFQEQQVQEGGVASELSVPYRFLHDRVQQAAYFLIPEQQKQATHLQIGQLLLSNTPVEEREEKIFEIVNQLNLGVRLITNSLEKLELIQLNLIAGKRAKSSTAYEAAVRYLTLALEILPENSWQTDYELTLDIYIEAGEAEYLNINFTRSAMLAETAMQNAASLLDRVKVYLLQMQISIAQLEMLKAIDIGLQILETLGISLTTLNDHNLLVELPDLSNLANIPVMTDPDKLSAMQILKLLCTPVFQAKPEIFPQVILTMIGLCTEYGHSALSAFAYGFYGLLLVGFGKLDAGHQAGIVALKLLEKFDAKELKAKVYNLFNSNIRTWKEAAKNSIVPLQEGVQSGLESGDIEWGGYCAGNLCSYLFFTGDNLDSTVQQQAIYVDLCIKTKQEIPIYFSQVWRQLALNLQRGGEEAVLLVGESFDEAKMLPRLIEAKAGTVLFVFYVAKTIICYHFREYEMALKNVVLANEQAGAAFGFMQVAILNFYHSLTLLSLYPTVSSSTQQEYRKQVEANQENLKFWADNAPMNNQHRYNLVEAEKARILGEKWQAADLYDRAILEATENKYIHEEALANELAAKFYLEWKKEKIARAYIFDAYYSYSCWGAKTKVEDLEKCYPQLLIPIWQREQESLNPTDIFSTHTIDRTTTSSSTTISDALDIFSLLKASQALSGEIYFHNLIPIFLEIVMENTGASSAALILAKGENLMLAATANCEISSNKIITNVEVAIPIEESLDVPLSQINYVKRTAKILVIDDATAQASLASDPYIERKKPKSLLCTPIVYHYQLIGILYLENTLTAGVFTNNRLEIIKVLCSQAAISIDNARLYEESQNYGRQLEESYQKLEEAQLQIIQSEKMATLGQLMAGIAHEINNPVGFIFGNIEHALGYAEDLIEHIALYQETYPNPGAKIEHNAAEIDLDFVIEDLPKTIESMREGIDRIREISNSMRIFARGDISQKALFNIHHGIDSTLLILRHRLKASDTRPAIEIIKKYGEIPEINCYPGQLNQVFMNLLANSIDALEESNYGKSFAEVRNQPNQITISTEIDRDRNYIIIKIADNGIGMPEEVKQRIFDHLFTTKPVGKGTGLGLSIGRQIVEKEHSGKLSCTSSPGKGTEFAIAIPL